MSGEMLLIATFWVPCPPAYRSQRAGRLSRWRWIQYRDLRRSLYASLLAQLRRLPNWESLVLCEQTRRKRGVAFTRFYFGREKPQDRINFATSLKPLLDCLTRERATGRGVKHGLGLLWDDSEEWCEDEYRQVRVESGDDRSGHVEVRVLELDLPF